MPDSFKNRTAEDMSPAELEQRREAGRGNKKHGQFALEASGLESLDPQGITRLTELRALMETAPGRLEVRVELAARFALLLEMGFEHMRRQAENGEDIWDAGPIKHMSTYANTLTRLMNTHPQAIDEAIDVTEMVKEAKEVLAKQQGDAEEDTGGE